MSSYQIIGGIPLSGTAAVSGAKNSALILHAASLLASGGCIALHQVPSLYDTEVMIGILNQLGVAAHYDPAQEMSVIHPGSLLGFEPDERLVRQIRASVTLLGPLLARTGYARMPFPGGDAIGARGIDLHLRGFQAMGAKVSSEYGRIELSAPRGLKGAAIYLDIATVTGTENLMMAATLAQGTTTLYNAAREPEVVDIANFLNSMGACVRGAGTDTIQIEGVRELKGTDHTVIPDRLEAATFLIAAAITRGSVFVKGAIYEHLHSPIAKLREIGITVEESIDGIGLTVPRGARLRAASVNTQVYPGIATDLQAPLMALLTVCSGKSIVTENLYEDRFHHVPELNRMGGEIRMIGNKAFVSGVPSLTGAVVTAADIRAGAALACAGLAAEGMTTIQEIRHIERGYSNFIKKMRSLGAQIRKTETDEMEVGRKRLENNR